MADAPDLKSVGIHLPCRFESGQRQRFLFDGRTVFSSEFHSILTQDFLLVSENDFPIHSVGDHGLAFEETAVEDFQTKRVEDLPLNGSF